MASGQGPDTVIGRHPDANPAAVKRGISRGIPRSISKREVAAGVAATTVAATMALAARAAFTLGQAASSAEVPTPITSAATLPTEPSIPEVAEAIRSYNPEGPVGPISISTSAKTDNDIPTSGSNGNPNPELAPVMVGNPQTNNDLAENGDNPSAGLKPPEPQEPSEADLIARTEVTPPAVPTVTPTTEPTKPPEPTSTSTVEKGSREEHEGFVLVTDESLNIGKRVTLNPDFPDAEGRLNQLIRYSQAKALGITVEQLERRLASGQPVMIPLFGYPDEESMLPQPIRVDASKPIIFEFGNKPGFIKPGAGLQMNYRVTEDGGLKIEINWSSMGSSTDFIASALPVSGLKALRDPQLQRGATNSQAYWQKDQHVTDLAYEKISDKEYIGFLKLLK